MGSQKRPGIWASMPIGFVAGSDGCPTSHTVPCQARAISHRSKRPYAGCATKTSDYVWSEIFDKKRRPSLPKSRVERCLHCGAPAGLAGSGSVCGVGGSDAVDFMRTFNLRRHLHAVVQRSICLRVSRRSQPRPTTAMAVVAWANSCKTRAMTWGVSRCVV